MKFQEKGNLKENHNSIITEVITTPEMLILPPNFYISTYTTEYKLYMHIVQRYILNSLQSSQVLATPIKEPSIPPIIPNGMLFGSSFIDSCL